MQIIKEKIETDVYKYICDTCKQSYISQRYIQKCEICGKDICNNCGPNYKLKTFTVKTKKDNYTETNFYLDVSDTDHYICKDCFENDKDKFLKYNKKVEELVDNFQTQLNNLQKDIIKK